MRWRIYSTQREEHHDKRRGCHHAQLAAHDLRDEDPLLSLGQSTHRLGVGQLTLVEDRLRGAHAQLLSHESNREREQGVEIEETVARVLAGRREGANHKREGEHRTLADAQQQPERALVTLARLAVVPKPCAQQARDRVEHGHREGACHHCLRHDIEPIATM